MNILKCVILSAVLLALSACTDYVAEIDDQIKELKAQKAQDEDSPVNPNIKYGLLTDSRDGQTYKTVVIGSQTWMAQNLNYETSNSYCYNDDASNCAKYGRLYTWAVAVGKSESECGHGKTCPLPSGNIQGVCPSGWHLPSMTEWDTLFNAVGGQSTAGKVLKSRSGWNSFDGWNNSANGTDAFGFSVLPAGKTYDGNFNQDGYIAYFWSSSEYNRDVVYSMYLYYINDDANLNFSDKDFNGYSVRCLKDDGVMPESSSSTGLSSSSESPFNPNIEYGKLTDSRDKHTYKTVTIGSQTWMAENLNYETPASYCYDDNPSNCTKFGRLYTWAAVMDSTGTWTTNGKGCGYNKTCSPTYPMRGVCPEGWHLPTQTEWEKLFNAVGGQSTAGTKLKSLSGWNSSGNGTDAFGFSALPAGDRDYYGNFGNEGNYANFWSSTEYDSNRAYYIELEYYDDDAFLGNNFKYTGYSVRCLKNDEKTTESSSSNETPKFSSSQKTESSSSSSPKSSDASSSGEYKPYDHLADLGSEILSKSEYRQFTDARNGLTYYYLTINGVDKNKNPASVTVMAENLNIGVRVDGNEDQKNDAMIERYCYDNDSTNCDKYGGLYQWAEMMQLPSECNTKSCVDLIKPNHQGICPEGWRLLTEDDFYVVLHADGNIHDAEDVRATSFGGYNYSGYSLVGAGYNWEYKFDYIGSATQWYYPVEFEADPDNVATVASMTLSSTSVLSQNVYKTLGLSVRCVMNQ